MAEPQVKHDDDLSEKLGGENEVDGHEKKSYLHRLKDKAIRMRDKVKKNMKGHGEEKAEEESGEEQDQTRRKSGGREQQDEEQEEKPMSSQLKDNSTEEFSSVKDHVDSKPEPEESLGQWESEGDQAQEKLRGFAFHGGPNSIEKQEEESPSRVWRTQRDGKGGDEQETPNFTEEVNSEETPNFTGDNSTEELSSVKDHFDSKPKPEESLGQWESEGDQAQENLGRFEFHGGSNSIDKQEEKSPSRVWKTQRDGEGAEEDEETPNFTEEVESEEEPNFTEDVESEEEPNFTEVKSEGTPNFTEVKSGGSGIGPGDITKESGLVQGLTDVVASDESSKGHEEKLGGFGIHGGSNSIEKQDEESPRRVWKTQRDGEGGEEEETPHFTDEVKSEKEPNFTEVKSEETPNFTEEIKSGGSGIGSGGITKESGLVQGPKDVVASDESIKDNEEEKLGGFGFHGGSNSIEKQEEESPSRVWKTQRDGEGGEEEETPNFTEVKSEKTPNFTEEVKSSRSGIGSGGMTMESGLVQGPKDAVVSDESIKDNEEEKMGEFGFHGGSNSVEKQEEDSPSRVWKTQRDGEGGEEEETPNYTEVKSEETPNFTEEVKSGGSGIGSRGMTKESGLVQGPKDVVASDESIKDNEEEKLGGFGFHGGSNSIEKLEEEVQAKYGRLKGMMKVGKKRKHPILLKLNLRKHPIFLKKLNWWFWRYD